VFSAVDGGRVYVCFEADTVEFGDGAKGVLDAGAVAKVEFQVGSFLYDGVSRPPAVGHHHCHCREDVHLGIMRRDDLRW
jgi:hypothetical protein